MMHNRFLKILTLGCLLSPVAVTSGFAQPLGHPAGSRAAGKFTVTALAAYARHDYKPFAYEARFYLARLTLGVTGWLDVAMLAGATDVQATDVEAGRTWWSEGYKPALGVGLWFDPLRLGPFSTFLAGTAVGYGNDGAMYAEEISGGKRTVTWDATSQKIGEVTLAGGLAVQIKAVRFYAAAGINRWWRQVKITKEVHNGAEKTLLGRETKTYDAEPNIQPLAGLQVGLPHRLFLSIEASGRSADDFWVAVSLGQTGSPD